MELPREVSPKYVSRIPLTLLYPIERPGTYQVRYSELGGGPGRPAAPKGDVVELPGNFLPSRLAERSEASLRILARYLAFREMRVRQYAEYTLTYFDAGVRRRVVPGREPLRGGVR